MLALMVRAVFHCEKICSRYSAARWGAACVAVDQKGEAGREGKREGSLWWSRGFPNCFDTAKQREACAEAIEARGDGHDPEIDPELGIVAARAACVPTFLVGLSPDARYDPRVLDARKRKIEADWSLALMAPREGPVSQNKARWLKAKANLRRVAADARDDEEAKNSV